jgi:hypothetical protein
MGRCKEQEQVQMLQLLHLLQVPPMLLSGH